MKEKAVAIDLESSGEFASVEKMLATTDANKFSTYLQSGAAELGGRRGEGGPFRIRAVRIHETLRKGSASVLPLLAPSA